MIIIQTWWFVALILQLFFWGVMFMRFVWRLNRPRQINAPPPPPLSPPFVTVIICARNESTNLRKNLRNILSQNYSNYEVLVVDDDSSDDSVEVLVQLAREYAHLRWLTLRDKQQKGKKEALRAGIAAAKADLLLLTDADCVPSSHNWVELMVGKVNEEHKVVLGYGRLGHLDGSLLNSWVRYETIYVALQYFSAAIWGFPYMGVGRNVLYSRSLLSDKLNWHNDLPSGDDDLVLNQVMNGHNTVICTELDTHTSSEPKKTWKNLIKQKQRHYSTATRYHWVHQLGLGMLAFSHLSFWLLAWGALFLPFWWMITLVLRCVVVYAVLFLATKRLNERRLWWWLPVLDVFGVFFYMYLAVLTYIGRGHRDW